MKPLVSNVQTNLTLGGWVTESTEKNLFGYFRKAPDWLKAMGRTLPKLDAKTTWRRWEQKLM